MENIYTSIEAFRVYGNFMGFFPLSFNGPSRKGIWKVKKVNILQVFISLGILFISSVANIIHYLRAWYKWDNIFHFSIWSWLIMVAYPMIFMQFLFQMSNLNEIKELFKILHEIDLKFQLMSMKVNFESHRKFVKYFTIFIVFTPILNYSFTFFSGYYLSESDVDSLLQELFYFCYMFYQCYIITQFITFTYLLKERFKLLGELLK
jgi:hypothetical protein